MANQNTTSLDLPPELLKIMQQVAPGVQTGLPSAMGIGPQQVGGINPTAQMPVPPVTPMPIQPAIPSFQEGGMVGSQYYGGFTPQSISGPDRLQLAYGSSIQPSLVNYADPSTRQVLKAIQSGTMPDSFYKEMIALRSPGLFSGLRAKDDMKFPNTSPPPEPPPFIDELPSYADGGMVGDGGMPVPPGAIPGVNPQMQAGAPMDSQMLQMQINQFASRNPQQMAQVRQAILEELQSGELTPQELNMIVQLATVAAQNPDMYPNVRNFAIQQGIATETDLPAQYDQGLVFVLLLAARAVQQDLGGAPAQAGQPPGSAGPVIPSMAMGGMLPKSGKSEPVIIEAHTGEYVIPKHIVDMKGKEFFDSMIEKYKDKK